MAARLLDVAFAGLLFVLSIYLWIEADGFPTSRRFAQADADFWPKAVFGTMALITAIMVVRGLMGLRGPKDADTPAFVMTSENWVSVARVGAMAGLILAFYFALQIVGFPIATITFLFLASFVIPYPNHAIRVAFALGFTVALVLFFTKALQLPLPRGTGVFYEFNVLFY